MASIEIIDEKYFKKYNKPIKYYMDDGLKFQLDTKVIPNLKQDKDEDRLLLIDGGEGAGKSTLGLQIGKYIDPSLDLTRVCFNATEFREAILKANKGQVVIYDEAFTGLSSRSSLSSVNRVLVSLMMQMRQQNLCVIIILPTFFLLDKYAAIFRSTVLIHVYRTKGIRGYFKVFNRKLKTLLYLYGSKTYNYSPRIGERKKKKLFTRFKGRFYGVFALGDEEMDKKYRDLKMKALEASEKDPLTSSSVKYREQRDIMVYLLRKELKLSSRKLASYLSDFDFDISYRQIISICSKYGDKLPDEEKEGDKVGRRKGNRRKGERREGENEDSDDSEGQVEDSDDLE